LAGFTPFVGSLRAFGTGNIIAPLYLLAGATTLGLVGREAEILRRTLAVWLVFTPAGGLLVCVFR